MVTIGYGDGLPRSLSGGEVLIGGQRAPIIGRICMDQTLVDVTDLPAVQAGDEVVLIGTSGSGTITAYDLAQQSDTITNEILSPAGTPDWSGFSHDITKSRGQRLLSSAFFPLVSAPLQHFPVIGLPG